METRYLEPVLLCLRSKNALVSLCPQALQIYRNVIALPEDLWHMSLELLIQQLN